MWIICQADDSHVMSSMIFSEIYGKHALRMWSARCDLRLKGKYTVAVTWWCPMLSGWPARGLYCEEWDTGWILIVFSDIVVVIINNLCFEISKVCTPHRPSSNWASAQFDQSLFWLLEKHTQHFFSLTDSRGSFQSAPQADMSHWDWSLIILYGYWYGSRRAAVTYWQKYVYTVLVICIVVVGSSLPRKSEVR